MKYQRFVNVFVPLSTFIAGAVLMIGGILEKDKVSFGFGSIMVILSHIAERVTERKKP